MSGIKRPSIPRQAFVRFFSEMRIRNLNEEIQRQEREQRALHRQLRGAHQELEHHERMRREQERAREQVSRNLQHAQDRIRENEGHLRQQERAQQQLSKGLQHAQDRIRENEDHLRQQERVQQQLSKGLQHAQDRIRENEDHLRQQKETINDINRRIDAIHQKEIDSHGVARKWLEHIKAQQKALSQMEMGRFFKKEYDTYSEQIKNMEENIRTGQHQACTALAQDWHTALKHELNRIEETCKLGKYREIEIEHSFEQVKAMMNNRTIRREFDTEEAVRESVDIEIPYWADELWRQAESAFKNVQARMTKLKQMDLAQMEGLDKELHDIVSKLNAAGRAAEKRFINHIRQMDMQESISGKLIDRGFEIVDNIFEDGDERKNNILLMENERGEKILVNIGQANEELNMEVNFSTLDPLTHSQRLQSIMHAIDAKSYETVQGYENKPADPRLFDLEQYRATSN